MSASSLSYRSTVGPPFQASKWQKIPLLIDEDEMSALFLILEPFFIFQTSGLISIGEERISLSAFLEVYREYILSLKRGELPSDSRMRAYFSSVWTTSFASLYAVPVNETQCLVKVRQPVIQLQGHRFDYSFADHTFRSMVMGYESIYWGIQLSYPHLFQDENMEVYPVREGEQFPNTALFKKVQQWTRENTIATPFEVTGEEINGSDEDKKDLKRKRVNVPIRLGKNCLGWINHHPQLHAKGLRVVV